MDDRSEGSRIEMDHARRQKQKIINKPLRCTSFLLRRRAAERLLTGAI
jgi:hypothetical protein